MSFRLDFDSILYPKSLVITPLRSTKRSGYGEWGCAINSRRPFALQLSGTAKLVAVCVQNLILRTKKRQSGEAGGAAILIA